LLITASRKGGVGYDYDTTAVVLLAEVLKLVVCLGFFAFE
jgi:hypothetical protein